MMQIKFTFIAGMALLFVGTLVGLSLGEVAQMAQGIRIEVSAQVASALRAAIVMIGILVAIYLIVRGTLQPRGS